VKGARIQVGPIAVIWSALERPQISEEWQTRLFDLARDLGLPTGRGFVPFMGEAERRFGTLPEGIQRMLDYETAEVPAAVG
jgi:hypothetical protein